MGVFQEGVSLGALLVFSKRVLAWGPGLDFGGFPNGSGLKFAGSPKALGLEFAVAISILEVFQNGLGPDL